MVGSTQTARKIAAGCARGAKRSMLLGGAKNILLVMENADLDLFVDNVLNSCYGSAGQRCLAGSIVAAVPEIYDEVLRRMVAASQSLVYGDAFDPKVYMGPLISRAAVGNVHKHIELALQHGQCELLLDGRNPVLPEKNRNGFFVAPTIIRDVTPCNPLFTTEVFGPLVATIKVADMGEALDLIHASTFGNGACIFTQSLHYAETFATYADVGMVGVNVGICAPHPYVPFGGIKGSLLGSDKVQGKGGLDFFTQNKVVTVRSTGPGVQQQKPGSGQTRSCVASQEREISGPGRQVPSRAGAAGPADSPQPADRPRCCRKRTAQAGTGPQKKTAGNRPAPAPTAHPHLLLKDQHPGLCGRGAGASMLLDLRDRDPYPAPLP